MQGIEHLRAPAPKKQVQGMQGIEHMPAPAPKEHMQGMQGTGHLRVSQSLSVPGGAIY